jgi:hypothetical protein
MTTPKLICSVRIPDGCSFWATATDGVPEVPPIEIVLTPGLYYISGDGTATDLLQHLENAQITAGWIQAPAQAKVAFTLNSTTHIVRAAVDVGVGIEADWSWIAVPGETNSAEIVRDAIRFAGDTSSLDQATLYEYGIRIPLGSFYPISGLQMDLEKYRPLATQLVPDSGNPQAIWVATRTEYRLGLRAQGYPRPSSGWTEYHDFRDFYREASTGRPFRLYPDASITTVFAENTNWFGYQTMVMVPDPLSPSPEAANWYRNWQFEIDALEYA